MDVRPGGWEVLAFGCELALLVALAVAGWNAGSGTASRVVLAVALPVILGVGWGRWLAPRSGRRLSGWRLVTAKVALFVVGGIALAGAGHPVWGAVLVVVSLGDLAAVHAGDRPSPIR